MDVQKIKLGKFGRQFKRNVLKEWEIDFTHDMVWLDMAAQTLDQIKVCEKDLEDNGVFYETKTGIKRENPSLKSSRELKIVFTRLIKELGLNEPADPNNLKKRGASWQK